MSDKRRPAPAEQAVDHDQPSPGRQAGMRLRRLRPVGRAGEQRGGVRGGPVGQITEEVLERIFRVNVFAAVHLTQAALPHLEDAKGCVVNTSSSTSILGKEAIPYSSTKGALNVFTKSLALELAERGVRVNAVVPGPFWKPAIATSDKETVEGFGSFTMVKRAGQPEGIAPAYVFLAADAPFSTGSFVEATGGFKATDA